MADSSTIVLRQPDPEVYKRLSEDRKLQYKEVYVVRRSIIDELLVRFLKWIEKVFGWNKVARTYDVSLTVIKWSLGILCIVLILYFLFKDEINKALFYRNRKLDSQVKAIGEDEFEAENIEDLIRRLLDEKNYSLALRYMYIRALQLFHEKGFINWTREKTNSEMLSELRRHTDVASFRNLGKMFEYVHYGNFPANENVGIKAAEDLRRIKQQTAQ